MSKTMLVPAHSGVNGASSTFHSTRSGRTDAATRSILRPLPNPTANVPPCVGDPIVGPHHPFTPSVVHSAASTCSGEAVKVFVRRKSSVGSADSVRSVTVGMGGILSRYSQLSACTSIYL